MIDPSSINSMSAAFAAGLVTSLHCVGMCGPVACVLSPNASSQEGMLARTSTYHLSRILSYTFIGALAGAIGAAPLAWFQGNSIALLPWVLVLFFVIIGLGLESRIPKPRKVTQAFFRLSMRFRQLPGCVGSSVLGFATPMLPCGPLYLMFGVALMTGSAIAGAEFMLAFAIGTLPLLWFVHMQMGRIRRWLSPARLRLIQRGMALLFAAIIALRLVAGDNTFFIEAQESGAVPTEASCPLCPSNR
jgi:sulfite exporter TauE/SafE